MIPENITPEEKRQAWKNLQAFMELSRRYDKTSNNSGAVVLTTAAPNFSEVAYE